MHSDKKYLFATTFIMTDLKKTMAEYIANMNLSKLIINEDFRLFIQSLDTFNPGLHI